MGQPVVQDQQLLCHGLRAGFLDSLHGFVTGSGDGRAVQLDAQGIAVHKVLDHTGQGIVGHIAGTDSINSSAAHDQHFAQDTQLIGGIVVIQEEGGLDTQQVDIGIPMIQVLLVHVQNSLLLLFGQGDGVALGTQDLHFIQLCGDSDDGGIIFVDLNTLGLQQVDGLDSRQVDFFLSFGSCFRSGSFSLGLGCPGGNGSNGQNHGQNQQHAKQSLGILHCLLTSFLVFVAKLFQLPGFAAQHPGTEHFAGFLCIPLEKANCGSHHPGTAAPQRRYFRRSTQATVRIA